MSIPMDSVTPIAGGFCVKVADDDRYCIDVMEMMYNWRILLSPRPPLWHEPHQLAERGYCYFAHGHDSEGRPRNKRTALLAAMAAAQVWTGEGDPPGFDKRAF